MTPEEIRELNLCSVHGGKRVTFACPWCRLLDHLQPTLPGFGTAELEATCYT